MLIAAPDPSARRRLPVTGALHDRGELLDSWKEIATYLRRDVRTVQLWEKHEGLPVRRHLHKYRSTVFALRSEIDQWSLRASRETSSPNPVARAEDTHGGRQDVKRALIGVLPFDVVGKDQGKRDFCFEIGSKTVAKLESLSTDSVSIIPLNSAGDTRPGAGVISYLLEGSAEFDSSSFKINVALVCPGTKETLWSYQHGGAFANTAGLSHSTVDQLAQCLWLKLVSCEPPSSTAALPGKRTSREAYLTGRYFWSQRSEQGVRKAIGCFESAVHKDPTFALAYSGLADCLTLLAFYEMEAPSKVMQSARDAAMKATELGPGLAEAHASLADIYFHFDRNLAKADEEYRRAIECNPNYATGYQWYANLLSSTGQHDAAQIAMARALEIDPASPPSLVRAGVVAHLARRYDKAVDYFRRALDLSPQYVWGHLYLAQSLEQTGNFEEASRTFDVALQIACSKTCIVAMKAHTCAMAGQKSTARHMLVELIEAAGEHYLPAFEIAAVYAALNDPAVSIKWLKRASQDRSAHLFTLTQDPRFDTLRGRLDFDEVLRESGFASAAIH
jgi:tetratricopeptide (TPR) repeat protein